MKALFLILPTFLTTVADANVTVNDFAIQCSGQVQVISTSGAQYSNGKLPHGRFPGMPASAGFDAVVKFSSSDASCAKLEAKYQLGLFSEALPASVSVSPVDLATTQAIAQSYVGKVLPVHFNQKLHYTNGESLPLYPHFLEESLWLSSPAAFGLTSVFKVDALTAHGVPSLAQTTDAQKIALAKKIVQVAFESVKKPGWYVPYSSLLASLESTSVRAKSEYLAVLISLFEGLDPDHTGGTAFFDFHVGGSDGASIANKIIHLIKATGSLSAPKIESLAFQFPALLLLGHPVSPTVLQGCFPISQESLLSVLSQWEKSGSMNRQQKHNATIVSGTIAGKSLAMAWCLQAAQDNSVIAAKAAQVYEQLK